MTLVLTGIQKNYAHPFIAWKKVFQKTKYFTQKHFPFANI